MTSRVTESQTKILATVVKVVTFDTSPEGPKFELELILTQMTQKPMLRAEVGMRVRFANKASAECIMRGRGIGQNSRKNCKKRGICG